eukprot:GHRQ01025122.1.p1 GENE.GHRQ01025122.1~~GHRQ01025122.1.p1  ORF type:complete len:138 (-),score=40.93 GHRQ01025122.1:53-466(-)
MYICCSTRLQATHANCSTPHITFLTPRRTTQYPLTYSHSTLPFVPAPAPADTPHPAVSPDPAGSGTWWGTLEFVAPEVARNGAGAYSPASDWWGLGVLVYNLLLGLTPWDGESYEEQLQQIRNGDVLWPPAGVVSVK